MIPKELKHTQIPTKTLRGKIYNITLTYLYWVIDIT